MADSVRKCSVCGNVDMFCTCGNVEALRKKKAERSLSYSMLVGHIYLASVIVMHHMVEVAIIISALFLMIGLYFSVKVYGSGDSYEIKDKKEVVRQDKV